MSLRLICGRAGTGKSQYCFEEIANQIQENVPRKIYMITPEQYSFTAEKKLLAQIPSKAVVQAEVLSFERMAYRLLTEVGGATKTFLSDSGKAMLLSHILAKSKKKLTFLGKSDQHIELLERQFTEFKKHTITKEILQQVTEKIEEQRLACKLKDMVNLYEQFEAHFENQFCNQDDNLTMLAESLEVTNLFNDVVIYLDEFVGFTNQEYRVIEVLLRKAHCVTITVCTDHLTSDTNRDTDVFFSNKQTADKLLYLAKKQQIPLEKTIFLEKNYRFKKEALSYLEKNLYTVAEKKKEAPIAEGIHLFLAANPYSEIEQVAKQITKLVKEKGYRYRDIAIITKDPEHYVSLCKVILSQYEIPYFMDEKKELSQNQFVKYLCAILDVFSKNWSYEAMFHYLKTGFIPIDLEEINQLENFCIKWGIKGSKWYRGEWDFEEETSQNKEIIKRRKELRNQIVTPLLNLKKQLTGTKTVEQITKELYAFLLENKIPNKIEEKKEKAIQKKQYEIAQEQETAWNTVISVFEELVMVLGEETVSFERYSDLLKTGLSHSGLGKIPMCQDQVIIGDVDRTRSHKVKAIFVIGVNDGIFPSIHKTEGFFDDQDRKKLKENGIELAKGTLEQLYEDNFNIYKVFTTAEEELYLSYPSSNLEGSPLRPSMLITKIKKQFPTLKETSDIIQKEYQIGNKTTTFQTLIEQLRRIKEGETVEPIWYQIYLFFQSQPEWKQKLEGTMKALTHTNLPEELTKKNQEALYGTTLHTSISKLEQFCSCPFSYFLKYGLQLSEKKDFTVQAIDTGNFMHETIDSFFQEIQEQKLSIHAITEEQIDLLLQKIIQEKIVQPKNYIFRSNAKYQLLLNRLTRVIRTSMKYILETLKNSDFEVLGNEIEFKKGKAYEPIKFTLENGKQVEITGKIDRVDIAKGEENNYIRIIDYKSSFKDIDLNEVYAGLQLQLLTYLDATCEKEEKKPAGVFYFQLIDPIIKNDMRLPEEQIEEKIRERFKMHGLIVADVKVVKMMDKTLETGRSKIVPAYLDKEGNMSTKLSNSVTEEQFIQLQHYTKQLLKQISQEITSGTIHIEPYYLIKQKKTPCDYCAYHSICQFKEGNHNHYRYIENQSKEEILEKIGKEEKNGI